MPPSRSLPSQRQARVGWARWSCAAALAAALLWTFPAAAQVSGRVIDVNTREAIPFANVALVDSAGNVWAQVATDSTGYFSVIPMTNDAVFDIQVIAMGYAGIPVDPIHYRGDPIHRTIGIMARPMEIEGLDVEVEGQDLRLLVLGFYNRKQRGYGYFIDPEMIRNTAEPGVTGLLRGAPSLWVRGNRVVLSWRTLSPSSQGITGVSRGFQVGERDRMAQFCAPAVFVDGTPHLVLNDPQLNDFTDFMSGRSFNDFLPPKDDILGIEVYRSTASLSREMQIELERWRGARLGQGAAPGCGAILIWTTMEGPGDGGG